MRHNVGDQSLVTRLAFLRYDDSFTNSLMRDQYGLNLTKLDAKTADLNLMVHATEKLDLTSNTVPCKIARTIHASPTLTAKRIGNKLLRRQVGPVEVTPRQAYSGDVQFAGHSYRNKLPVLVQDMHLHVCDCAANGHEGPVTLFFAGPERHVNGGFGRTIKVVQFAVEQGIEALL